MEQDMSANKVEDIRTALWEKIRAYRAVGGRVANRSISIRFQWPLASANYSPPPGTLCLVGVSMHEAIAASAEDYLGISTDDLEMLEAGFEGWDEERVGSVELFKLGREIAAELEQEITTELAGLEPG